MKNTIMFSLLLLGAIILWMLGVSPNNQLANILMAAAVVGVGAHIIRLV